MRKKLFFGLGLLAVVGGAVSLSMASRYQYHQFQRYGYTTPNHQAHRHTSVYRPHSYSMVALSNPGFYRNLSRNRYQPKCDLRTEFGCHYFNKQQGQYRPARDRMDYKLQRPHLYPRVENTFQSNRLVVRNGNYKDRVTAYRGEPSGRDFSVVDPLTYSVETYRFGQDNAGTYRAPGTSLAFRVLQSPDRYKCSQSNFWMCVNRLTINFRTNQNLGYVTAVNRDFRWNQTRDLSFERFPTVTESFDAANGQTYYIFSALNPIDGSIIRIEGVSNSGEKRMAAQQMHQVFETFRFRQ